MPCLVFPSLIGDGIAATRLAGDLTRCPTPRLAEKWECCKFLLARTRPRPRMRAQARLLRFSSRRATKSGHRSAAGRPASGRATKLTIAASKTTSSRRWLAERDESGTVHSMDEVVRPRGPRIRFKTVGHRTRIRMQRGHAGIKGLTRGFEKFKCLSTNHRQLASPKHFGL